MKHLKRFYSICFLADEAPGPDDPVCEGTSSWKRDCNWCNCEDGKAVCTEMACDLEGMSHCSVCVCGCGWLGVWVLVHVWVQLHVCVICFSIYM